MCSSVIKSILCQRKRNRANLSCQISTHVLSCPKLKNVRVIQEKTRDISSSSSVIVMFNVRANSEGRIVKTMCENIVRLFMPCEKTTLTGAYGLSSCLS